MRRTSSQDKLELALRGGLSLPCRSFSLEYVKQAGIRLVLDRESSSLPTRDQLALRYCLLHSRRFMILQAVCRTLGHLKMVFDLPDK
jgi:hypothetical protein